MGRMMERRPLAILLAPNSAFLDDDLRKRFELFHFHALAEPQRRKWLEANGARVAAVVTNGKVGCSSALIDELPNLGIIAVHGVGVDAVDLHAAHRRGIVVTNTPHVLTDDVADLAVGLVISLLRGIPAADAFVRSGDWQHSEFPLARTVTGRRFGIVGLGRIGGAIAERLKVFGTVAYTATRAKPVPWAFHATPASLADASDVLIVACSANESTRSLIGRQVLSALGSDGYLINIARGAVVDEAALAELLSEGGIAGAALDVFVAEPDVPAPLRDSDRTVLTPHIGSATIETRKRMAEMVLLDLDAFFSGAEPQNVVDSGRL